MSWVPGNKQLMVQDHHILKHTIQRVAMIDRCCLRESRGVQIPLKRHRMWPVNLHERNASMSFRTAFQMMALVLFVSLSGCLETGPSGVPPKGWIMAGRQTTAAPPMSSLTGQSGQATTTTPAASESPSPGMLGAWCLCEPATSLPVKWVPGKGIEEKCYFEIVSGSPGVRVVLHNFPCCGKPYGTADALNVEFNGSTLKFSWMIDEGANITGKFPTYEDVQLVYNASQGMWDGTWRLRFWTSGSSSCNFLWHGERDRFFLKESSIIAKHYTGN